ncbi:MAG: PAS domain S-box protein [Caldilineaceae bacterium]|nr:PAS domain S-box protein [Caldilineaceae bacterium]
MMASYDHLLMTAEAETGGDFVHFRKRRIFNGMLVLAAVLYCILALIILSSAWLGVVDAGWSRRLLVSILAVPVGAVIAYIVSRGTSVELGAALFLLLVLFSTALGDHPQNVAGGLWLVCMIWPIMAASILVCPGASFLFATIASLLLLLPDIVLPGQTIFVRDIFFFYSVALFSWLFVVYQEHGLHALDAINASLADSEARFRKLFADSPVPMLVYDCETLRILEVNEMMLANYGYTRAEFLSMRITDIHPPEDLLALAEHLAAKRQDTRKSGHWRHRRKDGQIIDVDINSHIITYQHQRAALVVAQDITAQKEAERQLHMFSRAVKQSPASIVITDAQGNIEYVNAKFTQLTGYSLSEVLGKNPRILKTGHTTREEYQILWETITSGRAWRGEFRNRRKNGEIFWESAIISPIRSASGAITNYLAVKEDITERKEYERRLRELNEDLEARVERRTVELQFANAALERASRMKDEFLANMSHELRTPLNAALLSCELLESGAYGELSERQRTPLRIIRESGTHLLELINDVLDISKMEIGKLALNPECVVVEDVCEAAIRFVKQQASKQRLDLAYTNPDPSLTLIADPRRLKQILVNLLSNAVKFTPAGGRVALDVVAAPEHEQIRFVVTDMGIGIKASDLPQLFQPFTQLDSGLNRAHTGTGLGLAMVRQLAELHGGSVAVSSAVGKGSTFSVTLPWLPEAMSSCRPAPPARLGGSTAAQLRCRSDGEAPRILLVEDNERSRDAMTAALQIAGARVLVASRGDEAIRSAYEETLDLILMDIQMPHVDGLEAIERIRGLEDPRLASIPIIALTALALPGDRERCLAAGADDYLAKPVTAKSLVETIQRHLASHGRLAPVPVSSLATTLRS